jgi:hypoxanthine phosphoribosyltransferase
MSTTRSYVAPGWDDIYEMLIDIALRIKRSGFEADFIVGVARGGWAPGRILSDLLRNACTANVKIEFYVGLGKTARKPMITQPVSEDVSGKKVLVVDDVSDTGESLKAARDHVLERGASDVRTVTVYFKPDSSFKPDFFANSTADWIIFPWERLEATRLLITEARSEGRGLESVRGILEGCGFDDKTVDSLLQLADGEP